MSQSNKPPSNATVLTFIVMLSFVCALTLSILASVLKEPQKLAKELDQSQQTLMSARIMNTNGIFQVKKSSGEYSLAKHVGNGELEASSDLVYPDDSDILAVYSARINPVLIDDEGNTTTFEKAGIDRLQYFDENEKMGYANLPLKLLFQILPNPSKGSNSPSNTPEGYIFPVKGFGLWDAIYGYLAIEPDANTVIGVAWYKHLETPGLGANIESPAWQKQFFGKKIFLGDAKGKFNAERAPLGISVVRGKVAETLANNPKANSAVDGMAGATLTGNGVAKAYQDTLNPYRKFLIKLTKKN